MRIEIWVDSSDPPAGRVEEDGEALPFCGWIDLLAVLSRVVGSSRDVEGEFGAGTQAQLAEDV